MTPSFLLKVVFVAFVLALVGVGIGFASQAADWRVDGYIGFGLTVFGVAIGGGTVVPGSGLTVLGKIRFRDE